MVRFFSSTASSEEILFRSLIKEYPLEPIERSRRVRYQRVQGRGRLYKILFNASLFAILGLLISGLYWFWLKGRPYNLWKGLILVLFFGGISIMIIFITRSLSWLSRFQSRRIGQDLVTIRPAPGAV